MTALGDFFRPEQADSVSIDGVEVIFRVCGREADDAYAVLEFRLEPGRLIPPHAHRRQLEDVNTFVLREARRRSAQSAQMMVRAVRALLRFLYVQGVIAAPLAAAVPSLARRS